MSAVGLFEVKTRLSEYVARAEAGEEIVIMRHNKPVAKIVSLQESRRHPTSFDAARRQVALAAIEEMKSRWCIEHGQPTAGLSVAMVREIRDERAEVLADKSKSTGAGR